MKLEYFAGEGYVVPIDSFEGATVGELFVQLAERYPETESSIIGWRDQVEHGIETAETIAFFIVYEYDDEMEQYLPSGDTVESLPSDAYELDWQPGQSFPVWQDESGKQYTEQKHTVFCKR